ncbi:MAG: NrfD/PsrC family molybdoenzyme membrane anchor subunit [Thermodesulfobacteriota bacterium]
MGKASFRVLAGLAILGLVATSWGMVERLLHGLNPVAFGSYVPWGLWVAFYLFFLGLSAGAFLVTILAYVFEWKRFEALAPLSAFVVLVSLVCELLFITLDLGRFERIYRFVLTPNPQSLMFWMFVLVNAMGAIYTLKTYLLIRGRIIAWAADETRGGRWLYRLLALGATEYGHDQHEADHRRIHRLSLVSLPVGLLFYGANGAFFAILMNRPIWNSALTPLLFIVAALLSGGALITFLSYAFKRDEQLITTLGRIILYLLLLFIFLEGLQFFVGYQTGLKNVVAALNLVGSGPYWWTFWIVHLLIGSLIPILLLLARGQDAKTVAWACLLIVATFLAVRFDFIIPDLAVYKLEGLEKAFVHPRLSTAYTPNLNEWLVSIWVVSLGVLLFALGARYLPVVDGQEEGEQHA